jgi:tripartite-type tricarboxylate transporter receptor subunit TctC
MTHPPASRPQRRRFVAAAGAMPLASLAALPWGRAHAQTIWPSKPVRLVVTFAAGGSSDIVARLIQPGLQERLGQPVVVDNKGGAGGTIGANEVAKAAADGHTLMLSNTAPISISPFMLAQPTYDPVKSFSHVFYIGSVPNVFVVHPAVPAKTLAELVTWVKAQTQPVNYGSGGVGSIGHIVGERFKAEYGLKMEHVPYKGSGPMHNDLLGGTLQLAVDTLTQNVPFMKDGKLRGLAVTSRSRMALAPDLPTMAELGIPKLVAENFLGVSGPAGLQRDVVDRLHKALTEVVALPAVAKRLEELGVSTSRQSADEFTTFVTRQVGEWGPAVKASGATLN